MMDVGPLEIVLYDKSVYKFPPIAKFVGYVLALSSVLMVPMVAIKTLISYPGSFDQVSMFENSGFFFFKIIKISKVITEVAQ